MRLGAPVFGNLENPDQWLAALQSAGYSAAFCPVNKSASDDIISDYAKAAEEADVIIAEVGAWSNPMSPDKVTRCEALKHCQEQLDLADKIGAKCCVNISGSRGEKWDGPHPDNLTAETFDLVVETTRKIIDAVKPTRTFFTLETMPWMYPDSTDSYVKFIHAIDRKQFAVHFDPVNLVCSPQRYFNNGALIREFVEKLGEHIKSCHAKDIALSESLTTHLDEVRPGLGGLDYRVYLQGLNKLNPDVPLMLEHLPNEEEYTFAAQHVRDIAKEMNISVK